MHNRGRQPGHLAAFQAMIRTGGEQGLRGGSLGPLTTERPGCCLSWEQPMLTIPCDCLDFLGNQSAKTWTPTVVLNRATGTVRTVFIPFSENRAFWHALSAWDEAKPWWRDEEDQWWRGDNLGYCISFRVGADPMEIHLYADEDEEADFLKMLADPQSWAEREPQP
jgi:hypothetical protein